MTPLSSSKTQTAIKHFFLWNNSYFHLAQTGLGISADQGWPWTSVPSSSPSWVWEYTGRGHHAWFIQCWRTNPGPCVWEAPYRLSSNTSMNREFWMEHQERRLSYFNSVSPTGPLWAVVITVELPLPSACLFWNSAALDSPIVTFTFATARSHS